MVATSVALVFPVSGDLTTVAAAGSMPQVSAIAQQRRRCRLVEKRLDGRTQIIKHRPALLTARRHHGPDPLAPTPARLPARALRYLSIQHHEPDRLFRQVV